jgi:hypothetical protein
MVKWMSAATDGRGMEYFEQAVFRVILQTSREAAFALVRFFRENTGRWKTLDCLEQFVTATETGDPDMLWTLKDAFTPHFIEPGRHARQVARIAGRLRDVGMRLEPSKTAAWRELYNTFIRTHLDPGWWPDDIWTEVQRIEARSPRRARGPYSSPSPESRDEFTLGGQPTPRAELEHRLGESVDSFCRTFEQLRSENSYFHGQNLVNAALRAHTGRAAATNEVRRLWEVARAARDMERNPELWITFQCSQNPGF